MKEELGPETLRDLAESPDGDDASIVSHADTWLDERAKTISIFRIHKKRFQRYRQQIAEMKARMNAAQRVVDECERIRGLAHYNADIYAYDLMRTVLRDWDAYLDSLPLQDSDDVDEHLYFQE